MAVTRLKRKDRRNKARAINKNKRIKQLTALPVIKNIDIEEIKAEFAKKGKGKKEEKAETSKEEKVEASSKKEVKAEKTASEKETSKEAGTEKEEKE